MLLAVIQGDQSLTEPVGAYGAVSNPNSAGDIFSDDKISAQEAKSQKFECSGLPEDECGGRGFEGVRNECRREMAILDSSDFEGVFI